MGQKHHGEMLKRLCQMQGYTQEATTEVYLRTLYVDKHIYNTLKNL